MGRARRLLLLLAVSLFPHCKNEASPCRLNSDCPEDERCLDGTCALECREDRDCPEDQTCTTGHCAIPDPPIHLCTRTEDCPSGQQCQTGTCGTIVIVRTDAGTTSTPDGGTPSPDAGVTSLPYGSVCTRAADCESMLCLGPAMATSGRCTRTCMSDADCYYPDRCTDLPNAGKLCAPATAGGASGEPCPNGPSTCSTGLCIEVPPAPAVCTHQCSPLPSCPAGMTCAPVADGSGGALAVCVPGTGGGFGEACGAAADCASALCVGLSGSGAGVCTSFCDQVPCPAGWSCTGVDDGAGGTAFVCTSGAASGGAFGAPCTAAAACASGLCLSDARSGGAFCTIRCTNDVDCSQIAGLVCVVLSTGDAVCAPL